MVVTAIREFKKQLSSFEDYFAFVGFFIKSFSCNSLLFIFVFIFIYRKFTVRCFLQLGQPCGCKLCCFASFRIQEKLRHKKQISFYRMVANFEKGVVFIYYYLYYLSHKMLYYFSNTVPKNVVIFLYIAYANAKSFMNFQLEFYFYFDQDLNKLILGQKELHKNCLFNLINISFISMKYYIICGVFTI